MNKLISFFLDRSFLVNLLSLFICVAGVFAATMLKKDLIPAWEFKVITINASLPGASPVDLEKNVTFPIEEALTGLPGLGTISSFTQSGNSRIELSFQASHDNMTESVDLVRARIRGIEGSLPRDLSDIDVKQNRVDSVSFLGLAVSGTDEKSTVDRDWITAIEDALKAVPGIVKTDNSLAKRKLEIAFNPKKLAQFGISPSEARSKVTTALRYAPVANLKRDEKRITVELNSPFDSIASLKELPIKGNRNGELVLLQELAEVVIQLESKDTLNRRNARDIVRLNVFKDVHSDAIDLKKEVDIELEKLKERLPERLEIAVTGDGPWFIQKQLDVLLKNGLSGFVLVLIVLTLFVGFKTAVVTSLGVPIAYLGTIVALLYFNISFDLISVVGMILVIGILVDDSIIVSERYVENLANGQSRRDSAFNAASKLIIPVSGTILTTIVAFSPILILENEVSNILFSIPVVIIAALLLSWFECFFILPNHLMHFVKKPSTRKGLIFPSVKRLYEFCLKWTLKLRYVALVVIIAFFAFTVAFGFSSLKTSFSLSIGAERIKISAVLKESSSFEDSKKQLSKLEKHLINLPKDQVGQNRLSIGEGDYKGKTRTGYRYATFWISAPKSAEKPKELIDGLKKIIEKDLKVLKTKEFEELTVQSTKSSSEEEKESTVTINISGGDRISFADLQTRIEKLVEQVEGVDSIYIDEELYEEKWVFHQNPKAMATYRIAPHELSGQLRQALDQERLTEIRLQGELLSLYTSVSESEKPNFKELSQIEIIPGSGIAIPLSFLGRWTQTKTLKRIEHKDLLRKMSIDVVYDEEKAKLEQIQKDISVALDPLRNEFPAFLFSVDEANERTAQTKNWALKVAVLCVALILLVLAVTLGSLIQPFVVGLAIPFGVIGVIWALYFHGLDLSLMAIIGLVGMAGVAVNDSLIMVHTINENRSSGKFDRQVLIASASSRLRAIVLTTITTLGGVFPMAYGIGGESGFTQPLGFSIGWGLASATLLIMFVIPVLIEISEDFGTLKRKSAGLASKVFQRNSSKR